MLKTLPLFLLVMLLACGPKKLAVKYADTYLEKQVEKHLPLTQAQDDVLASDIDRFLNGHKDEVKKFLPLLAAIDLNSAASLDEQYPKFVDLYLDLAQDFSQILARHIAAFSEKQQKEFLRTVDKENEKIAAQKKEYQKKIQSRITHYLGSLTPPQKEILKRHAETFKKQLQRRVERRTGMKTFFEKNFATEFSREDRTRSIVEAFTEFQKRALAESENLSIAKEFVPTLTPAQKKHLRGHFEDIEELVGYYLEANYN